MSHSFQTATVNISSLTSTLIWTTHSATKSKYHTHTLLYTQKYLTCMSICRCMEVMLPCDDLYLRSEVTQRHSRDCPPHMMLSSQVERELAFLIEKEIEFH